MRHLDNLSLCRLTPKGVLKVSPRPLLVLICFVSAYSFLFLLCQTISIISYCSKNSCSSSCIYANMNSAIVADKRCQMYLEHKECAKNKSIGNSNKYKCSKAERRRHRSFLQHTKCQSIMQIIAFIIVPLGKRLAASLVHRLAGLLPFETLRTIAVGNDVAA